jgi:beta-glucosidase
MRLVKFGFLVLALALVFAVAPNSAQRRSNNEAKINALLAQMTLAEKLGQLQQLDGEGNGNFRPEHRELVRKGLLGSTLNVRGAQRTNELQRIAVE